MLFEWDEAKSRRNLNERGFGFEYAARIFLSPTLERLDNRREYGEVRIQAIGRVIDDILSSITRIAGMPAISFPRGSPAGRSVGYGNRSPNNGKHPPNETARQSSKDCGNNRG
jgi:uncharacterized DUF497 family protein